jgi:hypothetical protein
MTKEYDDELNRRKLEEIGTLEYRIRGKRKDWLIILFVGVMVFSSCGLCATLTGHDISSLSNSLTSNPIISNPLTSDPMISDPVITSKNTTIAQAGETGQALQEQLSSLEGLSSSEQQLGNDPSSWEQWLDSNGLQYENSSDLGNMNISDYSDAFSLYGPGSGEYLNITQLIQGAYATNGSFDYDQLFGDEYGDLSGM